jgi:hypothetical protein
VTRELACRDERHEFGAAAAGLPMCVINCFLIFVNNIDDKMVRDLPRRRGKGSKSQLRITERFGRCRCSPRCSCRFSWSGLS